MRRVRGSLNDHQGGHSELARYYAADEKLFMPIDVVADLEAVAGSPLVSQTLVQMLSFTLVQLQPAEAAAPQHHWTAHLAQLGQETAAALKQIGMALSEHGTLTAHSLNHHQLLLHLNNLIQAAMQLKSALAQRQERKLRPGEGKIQSAGNLHAINMQTGRDISRDNHDIMG